MTADAMEDLCRCGHTRGAHHVIDENCCVVECDCDQFEEVNLFGNNNDTVVEFARRGAAAQAAADAIIEKANETSNDQLAADMDAEPGSPVAGMYPDQREESDRVQQTVLDNPCVDCGHRFGDHGSASGVCLILDCHCRTFVDKAFGELDAEPAHYPDHELPEFGGDRALVPDLELTMSGDLSALSAEVKPGDRVVPALLRNVHVTGHDLVRILGRDKAEEVLSELDPVTNNYGPEDHWQMIERLAGDVSPDTADGESRRPHNKTDKAIAHCLLDLRRLLGSIPSEEYLDRIAGQINKNAESVGAVGDAVQLAVEYLKRDRQ